ncbi:MAG: glutathione S-transferase N-terminal domain-containing protein [Gammaproteobacteria bacterium]|nr:glutathione S-transferase N-terminal domain-containing protein [Gammaproteobacteria bacterium]MBL7000181.1 glutathione S-transferase N-terminal domain-containing protein [Gammaproteobacteria bacterium]
MLLKILRNGLGSLIVVLDQLTRPAKMQRTAELQALVDEQSSEMVLYQLFACPFCIKTRRAIHRLNLTIEMRSVSDRSPYRAELEQNGGKIQVPCLRLKSEDGSDVWMYESSDIIAYLDSQFGAPAQLQS